MDVQSIMKLSTATALVS